MKKVAQNLFIVGPPLSAGSITGHCPSRSYTGKINLLRKKFP